MALPRATEASPVGAGPRLVVAPDLAEEVAWRAILRAERAGRLDVRARHHERAAQAYLLPPGPARDRAFGDLALRELDELGLLDPIQAAIAERPGLASRVDLVLLARALGPTGETVTCDPSTRRVGLRVTVGRFDDPTRLRAWARHALGHAEDSLDPDFGFDPAWPRQTDGASAERLHVLWDASVDGRAARAGRPILGSSPAGHRDRLAALLPPGSEAVAAALVERCWRGERPAFALLRRWAETFLAVDGATSHGATGSGETPPEAPRATLLPGGRCPLCRFPSAVLFVPDPTLAGRVAAAHPGWQVEEGLCERCHDRYRLVPVGAATRPGEAPSATPPLSVGGHR